MCLWMIPLLLTLSTMPLFGQWTDQQVKEMVTNSPWAKQVALKGSPVTIRWESAAPVIEACAQGGMERYLFSCASKLLYLSGLEKKFTEMVEHFWILSISNYPKLPVTGTGPPPPEHSVTANAELAKAGKEIQQTTTLTPDGGSSLTPIDVVVLPAGDALLVLLFFDRTAPLAPERKDMFFDFNYGEVHIKTRFHLADMQDQGKPAL
jgi:hypothetical protein